MSTLSSIAPGESGGVPTGGGFGGFDFGKFGLAEALQLGGGIGQGIEGFLSSEDQADVARSNAAFARSRAAAEAELFRRQASRRAGGIRAQQGASGTVVGQGSNADVLADQAAQEELNRLNIIFAGESQARQSEAREQSIERQGRSSLLGGISGGVTRVLPQLLI